MLTVDIEEAKKRLSKLVDMAARGEPFMISEDGKALVKVSVFKPDESFECAEQRA